MMQCKIPDREGLKLCISCFNTTLIFMIELGKADCHLSAARPRCGYDHKRTLCLDILILAKAFFADDLFDIVRITADAVMTIDLDTKLFHTLLERDCALLALEPGQHDTADIKTILPKRIDQTEYVQIIGDTDISTHLVFLNVVGIDHGYDFYVIPDLCQHADLTVRLKSRQNPGCMEIIKQLATKFKVQFPSEIPNPFLDLC